MFFGPTAEMYSNSVRRAEPRNQITRHSTQTLIAARQFGAFQAPANHPAVEKNATERFLKHSSSRSTPA
jgi:hypothetical protein